MLPEASLLIAAELAEDNQDKPLAKYCRETADCWNDKIEDWFGENIIFTFFWKEAQ